MCIVNISKDISICLKFEPRTANYHWYQKCGPLEQKFEKHSVLTQFANEMERETRADYVSQFEEGDANAHKWLHKMTYDEYLTLQERKGLDETLLTQAEKDAFLLKSEILARLGSSSFRIAKIV